MKRIILSIFLFVAAISAIAGGFKGTTLTDGGKYYLLNVYQYKFVTSWDGTKATLGDQNATPLLCTVTSGKWEGLTFSTVNGGYNLTNSTGTLMFDQGVTCTTGNPTEGFNADKSIWKLVTEEEYNAYKAKKRFTVASLNVDGMPKSVKIAGVYNLNLNPDGKEGPGATAIGQKLKTMGWDVVGLNEDFNFHSQIWDNAWNDGVDDASKGIYHYNATTHRGGINVVASTYTNYLAKKTLFDTDGLCLFYKVCNATPSNESCTAWNEHYGYTSDGADGLIDKGYRYYTVKLADGTEFDLYILHMDAEDSADDNAARESQIDQLVDAIKASHNGRPVIVMGDTNCRYTRDRLKTHFIDALNEDERFTVKDPWIEFARQGNYPVYGAGAIVASNYGYRKGEVVDKIFYINNTESDIRIEAESYCQDLSFINSDGEALADHWPCVAEISYHPYDPTIDDVVDDVEFGDKFYLRNRQSGYYLKAGGQKGTHAVQGVYGSPIQMASLGNGKYCLKSNIGIITQNDPYMDGDETAEWNIIKNGDYYTFTYKGNGVTKALTGNDPTTFVYGPNKRYVTCANYNATDKWQQWEMLTAEELNKEMAKANIGNPYNCTYLLPGANFDANDGEGITSWMGWLTDAKRMWSNSSDGKIDFEYGNPVAEVYVNSCEEGWLQSCKHATTWNIYQTLTVPNGRYKISCQAFQRISNSTSTTADINLYGKSGSTEKSQKIQLMYTGAYVEDESLEGETQNGKYYYPNSMAQATLYFNAGYYNNEVTIDVTDGTLTVGIKKTSDTGKDNTAWACFDNFQLEYLGPITDGSQYYIYNVDEGGFLNQGNSYGTQASLSNDGLKWTVNIADGGYTLQRDGQSNYLFVAWNGLYVDGGTAGVWDIAETEDGTYNITSTDRSSLIGWGGDPGCTVVAPALLPNDAEPRGTRWMLMTADDYNKYKSGVNSAFDARQSAWSIRRASIKNNIDYSELEALYSNPSASAADITSASNALKTAIEQAAQENATEATPYDVAYRIQNAACGKTDFAGWDQTNMNTNSFGTHTNNNDIELVAGFYEKWVASPSTLASSGSIKQTLSNLPGGYYSLQLDAIATQQDDKNQNVSGCLLYAGNEQTTINTPNGQVSTFTTPVVQVEENGSLEIGIKLENCTANWVAFDSFRLLYHGPSKDCQYSTIYLENDKATLTGTWRAMDKETISQIVNNNNLSVIDVTNANLLTSTDFSSENNPNLMIVANTSNRSNIANAANVIVDGQCDRLVVTDKKNFAAPATFVAKETYYSRENASGYNTVCLPFDYDPSIFGTAYALSQVEENGETATLTFDEVTTTIEAGTPVLIDSEQESWLMSDDKTEHNVVASPNNSTASTALVGSFTKRTIGEGFYKLNSAGTKFTNSIETSTITPFRFYITHGGGNAKELKFNVTTGDETSLEEILQNPETKVTETYDLQGRKVLKVTTPGIYVRDGKKVMMK